MTVTPTLSMAGRVMAFLRDNPEECLTADDVAAKFEVGRKNVHTLLASRVESGYLQRTRNSDGDYIYTAGPALASWSPDKPSTPTPKAKRTQHVRVDWATVEVDPNGPPPPPRRGKADGAYTNLLNKLTRPGLSFAVPANAQGLHGLRKTISARQKATQERYQSAQEGNQIRFWRLA